MNVTTEAVSLPDHLRHRVIDYALRHRIPYDGALAELVALGLNAVRPTSPMSAFNVGSPPVFGWVPNAGCGGPARPEYDRLD